jgi:hypothetical protein
MNEPVKPVVSISPSFPARPWKAMTQEAKRISTVNQPDIRGLSAKGGQSSQDYDSSGAASI